MKSKRNLFSLISTCSNLADVDAIPDAWDIFIFLLESIALLHESLVKVRRVNVSLSSEARCSRFLRFWNAVDGISGRRGVSSTKSPGAALCRRRDATPSTPCSFLPDRRRRGEEARHPRQESRARRRVRGNVGRRLRSASRRMRPRGVGTPNARKGERKEKRERERGTERDAIGIRAQLAGDWSRAVGTASSSRLRTAKRAGPVPPPDVRTRATRSPSFSATLIWIPSYVRLRLPVSHGRFTPDVGIASAIADRRTRSRQGFPSPARCRLLGASLRELARPSGVEYGDDDDDRDRNDETQDTCTLYARRRGGQGGAAVRLGSEYVKMDFKSVVYNAARDGKLKRLKVSTLTRARRRVMVVARRDADVSAITLDLSQPVRRGRDRRECATLRARRGEPPFVRDGTSEARLRSRRKIGPVSSRSWERIVVATGNSVSDNRTCNEAAITPTSHAGNEISSTSPGSRVPRDRRLRDDAPNGVKFLTFRGSGMLRRHRTIPQSRQLRPRAAHSSLNKERTLRRGVGWRERTSKMARASLSRSGRSRRTIPKSGVALLRRPRQNVAFPATVFTFENAVFLSPVAARQSLTFLRSRRTKHRCFRCLKFYYLSFINARFWPRSILFIGNCFKREKYWRSKTGNRILNLALARCDHTCHQAIRLFFSCRKKFSIRLKRYSN